MLDVRTVTIICSVLFAVLVFVWCVAIYLMRGRCYDTHPFMAPVETKELPKEASSDMAMEPV